MHRSRHAGIRERAESSCPLGADVLSTLDLVAEIELAHRDGHHPSQQEIQQASRQSPESTVPDAPRHGQRRHRTSAISTPG